MRKKEREKEDFLAFGRSKFDSSRTKSWSTQLDLRLDTKKLEFRHGKVHMHDYKPMDTPVEKNLNLSLDMCPKLPEEKEQMSKVPYSSDIRSLVYAMM